MCVVVGKHLTTKRCVSDSELLCYMISTLLLVMCVCMCVRVCGCVHLCVVVVVVVVFVYASGCVEALDNKEIDHRQRATPLHDLRTAISNVCAFVCVCVCLSVCTSVFVCV